MGILSGLQIVDKEIIHLNHQGFLKIYVLTVQLTGKQAKLIFLLDSEVRLILNKKLDYTILDQLVK